MPGECCVGERDAEARLKGSDLTGRDEMGAGFPPTL